MKEKFYNLDKARIVYISRHHYFKNNDLPIEVYQSSVQPYPFLDYDRWPQDDEYMQWTVTEINELPSKGNCSCGKMSCMQDNNQYLGTVDRNHRNSQLKVTGLATTIWLPYLE